MATIDLRRLPLGDLGTNCYLIWSEESREALVIDPADDGGFITQQILELQLQPQAIILTHGHFDHVLGLLELKLNFDIPVLMHSEDTFLLERAQASALHWLGREVDPVPPPDAFLEAGDKLDFGDVELTVMETPGHTPGSICLYNEELVFTGDTLFADGVGRTDFKYSDPDELQRSLKKIFRLPQELRAFPGHGEDTTLASAREYRQNLGEG